jgi:hypothetical protein
VGARSKAKEKARAQHARQYAGHAGAPGLADATGPAADDARAAVFDMIHKSMRADRANDVRAFEDHLDRLTTASAAVVDASLGEISTHILGLIWKRGWQPTDVARAIELRHGKAHRRWIIDLMASEIGTYPAARIHDRWIAQLQSLGADIWWADDGGHMRLWAAREQLDRGSAVRVAIETVTVINYLPDLPVLMPPPGVARRGSLSASAPNRAADQRMLGKVRGLLAKAESTKFPDEADAYSAKAQELMARYSIDHALLAGQDDDPDKPVGIRVTIEAPYAETKALLLQVVAEANLCRSVWTADLGFTTVFGFPSDLEIVEMLFTSLLVQGTSAMVREGSTVRPDGTSRTKSFRQSFMQAYALRIGERLQEVAVRTSSDVAETDARLLPVLASREKAVAKHLEQVFPEFRQSRIRISDEHGWASGTAAADRASLR